MCGTGLTLGTNKCRSLGVFLKWEARVAAEKKVKAAEEARISVRNVRRDGMEMIKKWEKEGEISEDEHHRLSTDVQALTDTHIKKIDDLLALKQKDIMQV